MILIREIEKKDLDALKRFSDIPGFINIPNDDDLLSEKIQKSNESFRSKTIGVNGKYVFVAEEIETGKILGTSMVAGQHGTEDSPHFYFEVGNEKKYSKTINTGFLHGTLKLEQMTNGPSELGGLVVSSDYRKHPEKIGRQLAFVRFLYMAMNPSRFRNRVIAELLPPLNKKGQSPLWEAVGRRFTNMDYWEADRLCQKNKEFIYSLFPQEMIYTTFLPAEARNAIGKVSKETEPVLKMLTKVGFKYTDQVDPFDGGPHLWATTTDILPIKNFKTLEWGGHEPSDSIDVFMITKSPSSLPFKAVSLLGEIKGNRFYFSGPLDEFKKIESSLSLSVGTPVGVLAFS